jgi:hypothetical protein
MEKEKKESGRRGGEEDGKGEGYDGEEMNNDEKEED